MILMNLDNTRLRDIQILKRGYRCKMEEADNMHDMFHYMEKIDELTLEEKEILSRCDVEI